MDRREKEAQNANGAVVGAMNLTPERKLSMLAGKDIHPVFRDLLDEDRCREWIIDWLHPDGPKCPACGTIPLRLATKSWRRLKRVCCQNCKKYYSAYSKTPLSKTNMNPKQLALLLFLIGFEDKLMVDSISEEVGVSESTVRAWIKILSFLNEMCGENSRP